MACDTMNPPPAAVAALSAPDVLRKHQVQICTSPLTRIALLERMRELIFSRKTILRDLIAKLGHKSLYEYVHGYQDVQIHPLMKQRQAEFLQVFEREIIPLVSPASVQIALEQLKKAFFVSTNDHHGPLNAFDFFNAHVVLAMRAIQSPQDTQAHSIIALTCGSVSLNNISFPRGLLFHAKSATGTRQHRLSFLPSNSHACPVYGFRPYTMREVEKVKTALSEKVRGGEVSHIISSQLEHVLTAFSSPDILSLTSFSDQMTMANERLWKMVFHTQPAAPSLVYIEQEWLVARLLTDCHLHTKSLLHHFIFDEKYEQHIRANFDGVYGAFDSSDHTGTYLFWAVPEGAKLRVQMKKEGNELVAVDDSMRVALTPDAIAEALMKKRLIPGLLLTFVTLSFYYGLKCLGGYSQVNYLTFMKESFMRMMHALGEHDAAEACTEVSTKNWSGFTFTFLGDTTGALEPAFFLDLLLYGNHDMWQSMQTYAHECTLEQSVQPLFHEMYRYSYRKEERDEDLLSLTPSEIASMARIRPLVYL